MYFAKKEYPQKIVANENADKNAQHLVKKVYDIPPQNRTDSLIPVISLDEDTDYESDEKDNYRSFWPFDKIIYFICFYFIKFFLNPFMKKEKSLCLVCYESFPKNRLIYCKIGHQICGKCIRKIARNESFLSPLFFLVKGFSCPEYNCRTYISYDTCTKMLPKRTRKHIQTKMYEALLKATGLEFEKCQKCDYLAIIPQINGMKIFQCPECSYTFCCDCGRKCDCNHSSEKCIKLPNSLNEKFSNALIHRCHRCKLPFIKDGGLFEGCNMIKCKCGVSQCYACRMPSCSATCIKSNFYATTIHKIETEKVQKSLPDYYQKLFQNTV